MAAYLQAYNYVTCELIIFDRNQLQAQCSFRVWVTFTYTMR